MHPPSSPSTSSFVFIFLNHSFIIIHILIRLHILKPSPISSSWPKINSLNHTFNVNFHLNPKNSLSSKKIKNQENTQNPQIKNTQIYKKNSNLKTPKSKSTHLSNQKAIKPTSSWFICLQFCLPIEDPFPGSLCLLHYNLNNPLIFNPQFFIVFYSSIISYLFLKFNTFRMRPF